MRLVAAAADGGLVIGKGGLLPWDLPEVNERLGRWVGLIWYLFDTIAAGVNGLD